MLECIRLKNVVLKEDFEVKTIEELLAENEALKSELKQKEEKIQSLEKLNNWYIEQLKLKAKEKFGASSEKADPNQISLFDLFNEAETLMQPIPDEPELETVIKSHTRKKAKRGSKFNNLETTQIHYELSDEEKNCDMCGEPLTEMTTEIRKELVIKPAEAYIVEHVTHIYSCRNCDKNGEAGFIKSADHPNALISKSVVSASMMAHIMNNKYTLALPLYRQEQEYKRLGFEISRQNLSNWILKGATLLKPLYDALIKQLLEEELLHADETTLEVLNEPGKKTTSKSYVWVYRTSKYTLNPIVVYEYTEGRGGIFPKTFLKNWSGIYLHCDGYTGYKQLEGKTLCGCLVHAKRKFHDAVVASPNNEIAKIGEEYIRKLFAIENKADSDELSLEERLTYRQTESKKIFDEFYSWITSIEHKTLPQSLVGKAINYALNQKEYLASFMLDARIQLSNNLAEQSVKPFVIGRKNWLFSNTINGAKASTTIYSIIQTAIANNLKPEKYLEFLFTQIQQGKDVARFVPWSEDIPEYCRLKKAQQE